MQSSVAGWVLLRLLFAGWRVSAPADTGDVEEVPGSRMVRGAGGFFLWCLGGDDFVNRDFYSIHSARF